MNLKQGIMLVVIGLIVAISFIYIGYKLDKPNICTIPRGAWTSITITSDDITCNDIQGWTFLSIEKYDQKTCMKFSNGRVPCWIAMHKDYKINRKYCNFEIGDRVWFWR